VAVQPSVSTVIISHITQEATMHEDVLGTSPDGRTRTMRQDGDAPPVEIPEGHIGPVILPGTGRMIWWTGRVAIGLRHVPDRRFEPVGAVGPDPDAGGLIH
jgi:hypothetical protein